MREIRFEIAFFTRAQHKETVFRLLECKRCVPPITDPLLVATTITERTKQYNLNWQEKELSNILLSIFLIVIVSIIGYYLLRNAMEVN
jgi:hypothetical protein